MLLNRDENHTANKLTYYSEAVYSIWEAEGITNIENGELRILYDQSAAEEFIEGGTKGIKTKIDSRKTIIYGPGYYQDIEYKYLPPSGSPDKIIRYQADYRMKITQKQYIPTILNQFPSTLPAGYEDMVVCTLQVTAANPYIEEENNKEMIVADRVLRVSDFLNSNGEWDIWQDFTLSYTLNNLVKLTPAELNSPARAINLLSYNSKWMQYKVIWSGLDYINLLIDKIVISDEKGRRLQNIEAKNEILASFKNWDDPVHVLGWMGVNEPASYDNYEPIRIIEELIKNESDGKFHLYATFTSGWKGVFGHEQPDVVKETGQIYKAGEFLKKTKIPFLSLNIYNYNFPYLPHESSAYQDSNINYVINNLQKLNEIGTPFAFSTQSGKFYFYNDDCTPKSEEYINPEPKQMLYHINLGLMYGMQELTMDPIFTLTHTKKCEGQPYRDGLVDTAGNLTELGETWAAKVVPRMSGIVGRTMKKLKTEKKYHDFISTGTWKDDFLIMNYGGPVSTMDAAVYKGAGGTPEYLMVLNRYYSPENMISFKINKKLQATYSKWRVRELISDSIQYKAKSMGYISVNSQIEPGDCRIFEFAPVVTQGGEMTVNDTVTGYTTLYAPLTVKAGAKLVVNGVYKIKADISVSGEIEIKPGAKLYFENNSSLNIWNGILNCQGTAAQPIEIDFISRNRSIQLSASSANLTYTTIKNAQRGIYAMTGSSINISNCTLYSNYYGLVISNANSYGGNNIIYNNQIFANTYGIYLYYSSPNIRDNNIYNNITAGIYCYASSPRLGEYGLPGGNRMYGNLDGMLLYLSNPFLGEDNCVINGGYNQLFNNSRYNINAVSFSSPIRIMAENNWWGSTNPSNFKLYVGSSQSSIDYDPFLTYLTAGNNMNMSSSPEETLYDENLGSESVQSGIKAGEKIVFNNGWDINRKLQFARSLIYLNKNQAAQKICKDIITENPDSVMSYYAMDMLNEASLHKDAPKNLDNTAFKGYTDVLAAGNLSQPANIYAAIIRAAELKDTGLSIADKVYTGNKNNIFGEAALFHKFMYYLFERNMTDSAGAVLNELSAAYPSSESAVQAQELIDVAAGKIEMMLKKGESGNEILKPKSFELLGNYPNPFNPSTSISYSLPYESSVELKIYDLIGREVKSFSLNAQPAGYQKIIWDGENNNGIRVSSGVYLYRIILRSLENNEEYIKTAKLILMK